MKPCEHVAKGAEIEKDEIEIVFTVDLPISYEGIVFVHIVDNKED